MPSTEIEFAVHMTCENCVNAVKKCLQSEPEIKSFDVDLTSNRVIVETTLGVEEVKKKLESTGRKVVVKGAGSQAGVAILDIGDKGIQGVVRFFQNRGTCVVDGTVDGLKPGKHGLAIHECGDVSNGTIYSAKIFHLYLCIHSRRLLEVKVLKSVLEVNFIIVCSGYKFSTTLFQFNTDL